jgi:N-carbamoylputrescine amidase
MKTVRVAAIQIASVDGQIEHNLARAAPWVEEAKRQGAQLVLLPEFMPTGYALTPRLWNAAETSSGPTVTWLQEQARRHAIWIGTSFLEAVEDRFHNTFVLMNPDGAEAIRVRKTKAAALEAYFFEGCPGRHVVNTPLGRIGVSICYENSLATTIRQLWLEDADLVLMPHSAPSPTLANGLTQADVDVTNDNVRNVSRDVALQLGVPTVMANKVGPWRTRVPRPFLREDSSFPGLSAIVACDGEVLARMRDEEGVIVADVALRPERKAKSQPRTCGRWARPVPPYFARFAVPETLGGIAYRLSRRRRRKAREVSQGGSQ